MATRTEKKCPRCDITKPVNAFYERKCRNKTYASSYCKACSRSGTKAIDQMDSVAYNKMVAELQMGVPIAKVARKYNISRGTIYYRFRN